MQNLLRTIRAALHRPRRIYLDHAAATPTRPEVVAVMRPYFTREFGNPSAIHTEGQRARQAVEDARTSVARTLGVRATDVTFVSGGTEANNLALHGHVRALQQQGIPTTEIEIISTRTEHPSILRTLDTLAAAGCTIAYVPVAEDGRVRIETLATALSPRTRLVTIAYANSETGVVQDIARISRAIQKHNEHSAHTALLHTDASQAPLWRSCKHEQVRADMMTLDAGKFGGPKGVGVLVHRPRVPLAAVTHGGSQESDLRPGTENVALIVGCAAALERAQHTWKERSERVVAVREHGIDVLSKIKGVVLNGSATERLANNINISLPGLDTEFAVVSLDAHGIACSTKSACSGAGGGRSEVVFAMTGDESRARSTIRFTLGEETSRQDMDHVAAVLQRHVQKMLIYTNVH